MILQETCLALLRNEDLLVYANAEQGNVPFQAAESTFNRLSISERSKLKKESVSNFDGEVNISTASKENESESVQKNEYIAVTILIASKKNIAVKESISFESIKDNLKDLGSTSSSELIACEIIWQPQGERGMLSSEELVISYPNLKHL